MTKKETQSPWQSVHWDSTNSRYRYEFTQWLPLTLGVNKRGEQIEFDGLSAEGGRREMWRQLTVFHSLWKRRMFLISTPASTAVPSTSYRGYEKFLGLSRCPWWLLSCCWGQGSLAGRSPADLCRTQECHRGPRHQSLAWSSWASLTS